MAALPHFGAPFTRSVAPQGDPPNAILTGTGLTTAYGWVLRQANYTQDLPEAFFPVCFFTRDVFGRSPSGSFEPGGEDISVADLSQMLRI